MCPGCFSIMTVSQWPEPERHGRPHSPIASAPHPPATRRHCGPALWAGRSVVWAARDKWCTVSRPRGHNPACSKNAEKRPTAFQPVCAIRFPPSLRDAGLRWVARRGQCRHRAAEIPAKGSAGRWSGSDPLAEAGRKPPDAAGISALRAPFHQIDVSYLGPRTCRAYMIAVCQDWHVQETPHDHRFANRLGRYRPAVST